MRDMLIVRLRQSRRGAVAVLTALATPVMIASAALGVDGAMLYTYQNGLQVAADAAALTAAHELGIGSTTAQIAAAAQTLANANKPPLLGASSILRTSDVTTGTWNNNTFTPGGASPNAVKIVTRASAATGNAAPFFFAGILGQQATNLAAGSIALSACSPATLYNNTTFLPTNTKIITLGDQDSSGKFSAYLETSDGHPILRIDNSYAGSEGADVTFAINPYSGTFTRHLPSRGTFYVPITEITDNGKPGTMTLVFQVRKTSAGTFSGGTATWVNTIRQVATISGVPVCAPGAKFVGRTVG